ncbi:DUF3240 family protein [Methylomagnum ishizawai]|uniref:DUF3240 family protein n=1 Tax=Methylomagnum ishizawai TaxID=1760988 RepID=UPI001C34098F|nr:DUF3240 family protein [Methylomagnum ishizawai]BBL73750.1 hypothetical protein MishRS11D_08480 [Methylomagnum ishizawai]
MSEFSLLTLICPPGLEEPLVDWLLESLPDHGFSTFPVSGHSSRHQGLSLAEQVAGRKRQVRFELHAPEAELFRLVERLTTEFAGTGLHYWMTPVLAQGRI